MQAETGRADKPLPPDEIEAPPDPLADLSKFTRKKRPKADKPDEWDEMAAGLLPCTCYYPPSLAEVHTSVCPAAFRQSVAAKLRELAWEHKRIFDEAANDSERKLALIKAYKAKLAEAERERDEAREMSRTGDALREHNRARKAERERDNAWEHRNEAYNRKDKAERERDEALAMQAGLAADLADEKRCGFEMSADLERERAKYREAVELMRPIAEYSRTVDDTETPWIGGWKNRPNVGHAVHQAIARFVEAADKEAK